MFVICSYYNNFSPCLKKAELAYGVVKFILLFVKLKKIYYSGQRVKTIHAQRRWQIYIASTQYPMKRTEQNRQQYQHTSSALSAQYSLAERST